MIELDLYSNPTNFTKIGEGRYREVFRIGDDYTLKIMKPYVRKDYGLVSVDFPTSAYTKYKFGIEDFIKHEQENYNEFIAKIPPEMRRYFAQIYQTGETVEGKTYSLGELIVNYDSSLSKPLSEYESLPSQNFWDELSEIEEILLERQAPLLDFNTKNILVHETEKTFSPTLIDFKRYGLKSYPVQRLFRNEEDIIRSRFEKLRKKFK